MSEPQFYEVEEAAKMLRVSRKTVYDWMRDGRLGYVQAGQRKRLIPRQAITQMMRKLGVGLDNIEESIEDLAVAA